MAVGMATGKCWFKVPDAIKVELVGRAGPWVSGKDIILTLIGILGVDGARYSSLEFCGEGVKLLSMDERFTIANMAVEAGAKNGIFEVDDTTLAYVKEHSQKPYKVYKADDDAVYKQKITIDLSKLTPVVAVPHLPSNIRPASELGDVKIDQVVIGSCTNGRIDDMRTAANVLKGKHLAKNVRAIVIPATQKVYLQMIDEGLAKIFIEAGCAVSTPTCGPCLGGHMGILAADEVCISTTNRNFVGRMGDKTSKVYLASPAVAAASGIAGRITVPQNV